eukprot:57060_1
MTSSEKDSQLGQLQNSLVLSQKRIQAANVSISMNEQNKRRTELTIAELSSMSSETETYRSVGRMFLHTPIEKVRVGLNNTIKKCESNTENLKEQKDILSKKVSELVTNINEIMKDVETNN